MDDTSAQQVQETTWQPRQVHTITDRFSMANTYLLNDTRFVVVDPGSTINVRLLVYYMQAFLRRSPSEIDLIVLTHLHPDHTAGVESLRSFCKAPVAASVAVRHMVQAEEHESCSIPNITHLATRAIPGVFQHFDLFPPAYTRQAKLIDLWLEDVVELPKHPNWRVIASPGHTPESICLYNPFTSELLCGDTVITISGGTPLLRSGTNRSQIEETLRVLRNLPVRYLYPGHGRAILSHHPLNNAEVEW